jgi:hypothetical protein
MLVQYAGMCPCAGCGPRRGWADDVVTPGATGADPSFLEGAGRADVEVHRHDTLADPTGVSGQGAGGGHAGSPENLPDELPYRAL